MNNKNKAYLLPSLLLFFLLFLSFLSFAQPEPEDIESIISDSQNPVLQPVAGVVLPVLKELSIFVGGIFGLYVILILIRVYYERKKVKILEDIRFDLDQLNLHQKLPDSRDRKTLWRILEKKIKRNRSEERRVGKECRSR